MSDVDGRFELEYRLPSQMFLIAGIPMGILIAIGAFVAGTSDDNSTALKVILPSLMIGGFVLFLWAARRSGTYVSRDGIVTRGMVRRTSTPWQGIQDIKITQSGSAEIAVIYDYEGRKLRLPQLNSSNVLVADEVQILRELWEKRRGPRWKPIPSVTAQINGRKRR
ncbi:PH domain-containing protein [Actinomadura rudentiformis]|uniref:Low molecular weight protein antigen 6 PH domain-containing protein n=1 Tax=Actinomadura rudentiformis TaxID=359158 RepID=A0A6H9YRG3_9ACTN|nr:PH domain-containing protein [Actinomadura rudentiformis]KAB2350288.1 hypothetical protein F8566_10945 [Actinomadura rudentiformis]